jgi:hypothetical protein
MLMISQQLLSLTGWTKTAAPVCCTGARGSGGDPDSAPARRARHRCGRGVHARRLRRQQRGHRGGQDRQGCLRLRLSDRRHRDRPGRGACVGGVLRPTVLAVGRPQTSTEPRSNHASAARSTTACNWARTGMDGPTSEPPGSRHGTSPVGTTSLRELETGARSARCRRKPCDHECLYQEDAVVPRPRAPP